MRKPLVVLGVAAAALIVGGVATTRAMAQEPPDEFLGLNIFGAPVPAVSEVPVVDAAPSDAGPSVAAPSAAVSEISPDVSTPPATRRPAPDPVTETPSARPSATRIKAEARKKSYEGAAVADPIAASHTTVTAQSVSASPGSPVQQQILALVNRYRAKSGCPAVSVDRRLIEAANRHAADMARRDYFQHESPNGDKAGERVSETGYQWRWYGENIARGQDSPWEVMDGWMNSPEHRSNILDCKLDQIGVGLAIDGDKTPYWVQDFATPK
ncbi:CAP domain-containing protein [Actinoplanes sp. L3-i22]|uniref:CAP domain-containing protein n=1 Tax=Actinoplanes sp. L3-i22 TaxID=2836373 RepID=UPI001C75E62C|nr:CAP domain-containing protein [Actinoplanes sp. L3-i22]BCY12297.1 hypothetical protein L3i22_073850 [Actinoplanes sp. L3-i22]